MTLFIKYGSKTSIYIYKRYKNRKDKEGKG